MCAYSLLHSTSAAHARLAVSSWLQHGYGKTEWSIDLILRSLRLLTAIIGPEAAQMIASAATRLGQGMCDPLALGLVDTATKLTELEATAPSEHLSQGGAIAVASGIIIELSPTRCISWP